MQLSTKQKQLIIKTVDSYEPKFLAVFGSYATGMSTKDSDLDLLIDFKKPIGIRFYALAEELEEKLGTKVDIMTPRSISRHLLPYIKDELVYIYGEERL